MGAQGILVARTSSSHWPALNVMMGAIDMVGDVTGMLGGFEGRRVKFQADVDITKMPCPRLLRGLGARHISIC